MFRDFCCLIPEARRAVNMTGRLVSWVVYGNKLRLARYVDALQGQFQRQLLTADGDRAR
jgi:hypothetical protein